MELPIYLQMSCNEKKKWTPLCLKCWNFDFSVTCNCKYRIPKWWSAFINNISFELHGKPVIDFHYSYFTDGEREINRVSVKNTHLDKSGCELESWKSQTLCFSHYSHVPIWNKILNLPGKGRQSITELFDPSTEWLQVLLSRFSYRGISQCILLLLSVFECHIYKIFFLQS